MAKADEIPWGNIIKSDIKGEFDKNKLSANEKYKAENLKEHLRDNTLFIGYAPSDNPQIALSIVVEKTVVGLWNDAWIRMAGLAL